MEYGICDICGIYHRLLLRGGIFRCYHCSRLSNMYKLGGRR